MSQKIYTNSWATSFSWTATQDCWVFGCCDTRETNNASIIYLNDVAVILALLEGSSISQIGALIPCKKGDIISKKVNGKSVARIDAYAMRV